MNRAEVIDVMRDFLDYGPPPADDGEAYDAADVLLGDSSASTAELIDALDEVLTSAREAMTHHQHMLREAAEKLFKREVKQ